MDKASEAILALKPVTFHYKSDSTKTAQFGLIAEEVEKVIPDLAVRDKEGKPYTVSYDQVNAMFAQRAPQKQTARIEDRGAGSENCASGKANGSACCRAPESERTARTEQTCNSNGSERSVNAEHYHSAAGRFARGNGLAAGCSPATDRQSGKHEFDRKGG
jgi:hypothetical protein